MLRVIGAGLPRTGTSSLKAALERLGYGPCHHMFDVFSRPGLAERWAEVAATPVDAVEWEKPFGDYASAVDWPASFFWRELAAAYPDAKVVLTVRDPAAWYASVSATIFAMAAKLRAAGDAPLPAALAPRDTVRPLLERMWRGHYGTEGMAVPDEATAVAAYERHVAAVRAALPADRLLVMEAAEGWAPLCAFLGAPVPDEPFPRLNEAAAMRAMARRADEGGGLVTPFDPAG
ncbi:sulfotransferase family protein [Nocardiopsis trehalosi]|jgi:hypothetical protein|uniref:sulfotransferase family protein n=1 Tax=Nocardiopsis trehalosi TaxID=109329 RepID=UPI00082EBEA5|nr:sulfotransferase family protein [Nocardiopsis trehalosi]